MTTDCALPAYAPEHPAFAGHFPGNPIVPGVLLLDAALHHLATTQPGSSPGPCHVSNVKFLSLVQASEDLRLHLRHDATAAARTDGSVQFVVLAAGRKAASGSLQNAAAKAAATAKA